MNVRSTSGFASVSFWIGALFLALGCSQGSDIRIGPPDTSTTSPPTEVPVQAPKEPSTPVAPVLPATARYRLLCDDRYPPYLMAISSLASPSGFGAGISVVEEADKKTTGLEQHEKPLIVNLPKFGQARILFSARKLQRDSSVFESPRSVFIADTDIVTRSGVAHDIGPEVIPASAILTRADAENLAVRTFGVSDQGRYLLLGQSAGYTIFDSTTLLTLGQLKTGDASQFVNPHLRESDMTFVVSEMSGGAFTSRIYSLSKVTDPKSILLLGTIDKLRRPLVAVGRDANESYAALDIDNRLVVVTPVKSSSSVTRSTIADLPESLSKKEGRLASSVGFWREMKSKELRAVVAFENFKRRPAGRPPLFQIEQTFVRPLAIDETKMKATAFGKDFEYPVDALRSVESGLSGGAFPGVSEIQTSPDGRAVFALFPGLHSSQLYRLTANGLNRVSQEACSHLSIGVEL